jgi:nitrite reductase/ring-hydroxylating ferredoxin subunit
MGNLMREYWIPSIMSNELPAPDCPPMRLRLLGENLIAFRTTSGKVGIVANSCPHRGASLFFGRNEEEGLRCVYHGWKFDVDGNCVDMPSEPAESNFKSKVHATAYPCIERNNMVWTYMGPRETPPPLPDHPGNMTPECRVSKSVRDCNYMQSIEGDIDTVHQAFLHHGAERYDEYPPGSVKYYAFRQRDIRMEVMEHEIGTTYGAFRPAEEDTNCWRIGHFLLPFYTMSATGVLTQKTGGNAWVPIDDEHCMVWGISEPSPRGANERAVGGLFDAPRIGGDRRQQAKGNLPDTSDWIGKFRPVENLANDYFIDREAQSKMETFTGIATIGLEDRGMQESMGPVWDRTKEHLGTTDQMVIQTRRKLIRAAIALRDHGTIPAGVDDPSLYRMYAGGAIAPKGVSGLDYCHDYLFGHKLKAEATV